MDFSTEVRSEWAFATCRKIRESDLDPVRCRPAKPQQPVLQSLRNQHVEKLAVLPDFADHAALDSIAYLNDLELLARRQLGGMRLGVIVQDHARVESPPDDDGNRL